MENVEGILCEKLSRELIHIKLKPIYSFHDSSNQTEKIRENCFNVCTLQCFDSLSNCKTVLLLLVLKELRTLHSSLDLFVPLQ